MPFTHLSFASVLLLSPLAGAAEGAPVAAEPPPVLQRATALASLVEDEEFRSRIELDLVEHHLRGGFVESAAAIAKSIPDYRRGIALGQVAAAFAQAGEKTRVAPLIEQALEHSGFPHPWQGDAIRAEAVLAWAAAGEPARTAELAATIQDSAAKLRSSLGRRPLLELMDAALESKATDKMTPELLVLARAAIEAAEKMAAADDGKPEEITTLCERAEKVVRAGKATAGEELLDLGILWRRLGDRKKSAEVLTAAIHQMPPGSEMHGWRPGYFARLVRLYAEAGDEEKVTAMLAAGRQGIAPLHAFHQVPAFCQLAEAQIAAGRAKEAESTWAEAVRIAVGNPNPSSTHLGAAQVAFSIARAGCELPAAVAELLDSPTFVTEPKHRAE